MESFLPDPYPAPDGGVGFDTRAFARYSTTVSEGRRVPGRLAGGFEVLAVPDEL
jgi:hypothetical protein